MSADDPLQTSRVFGTTNNWPEKTLSKAPASATSFPAVVNVEGGDFISPPWDLATQVATPTIEERRDEAQGPIASSLRPRQRWLQPRC